MANFREHNGSEFDSSSPTVSFPDHYLVPYIQRCKKSKGITCGCSLFFIGLAIWCFFATNYMINYPVTESRKIAFVFGGVFCLVAAASCLNLRFRFIPGCRDDPNDTILFEITERGFELSDSFSGHLAIHETSFCNGTPNEETSQTQTQQDPIRRAHSIDDPCFVGSPAIPNNDPANFPRRSISDGIGPDTQLLPQGSPTELERQLLVKKRRDSKLLQRNGIVSDNNRPPPNYSTFQNGCDTSDTDSLRTDSTYQNGCDTSETEPLLGKKS